MLRKVQIMLLGRKAKIDPYKEVVCGVYKITHLPSNDFYIGGSINIAIRERTHRSELRAGISPIPLLQAAFSKYVSEEMRIEVIERCQEHEVYFWERWWIRYLDPKLNTKKMLSDPTSMEGAASIRLSPYTREKIGKIANDKRWTLMTTLDVIVEHYEKTQDKSKK